MIEIRTIERTHVIRGRNEYEADESSIYHVVKLTIEGISFEARYRDLPMAREALSHTVKVFAALNVRIEEHAA